MSGLDLKNMEATDFLDVIHFYFEEDSDYSSPEQAIARSRVRSRIYEDFYERPYPYKIKENKDEFDRSDYLDGEVKPYIPPTEMNPDSAMPFGSVLDAPLR